MNEKMEVLEELCDVIFEEMQSCAEKLRASNGKLSPGDAEYIDTLAHAAKSIKTTVAMMGADGGYSGRDMSYRSNRGSYEGGSSGARRRDSMGRYSRDGYQY